MRALLTISMLVEVPDEDALEELRAKADAGGWTGLVYAVRDAGLEMDSEEFDRACLYLGASTQVIPERTPV